MGLKSSYGGKVKSHKEVKFSWGAINNYPGRLPLD